MPKLTPLAKILAKFHIEQSWTTPEFQHERSAGSLRLLAL